MTRTETITYPSQVHHGILFSLILYKPGSQLGHNERRAPTKCEGQTDLDNGKLFNKLIIIEEINRKEKKLVLVKVEKGGDPLQGMEDKDKKECDTR